MQRDQVVNQKCNSLFKMVKDSRNFDNNGVLFYTIIMKCYLFSIAGAIIYFVSNSFAQYVPACPGPAANYPWNPVGVEYYVHVEDPQYCVDSCNPAYSPGNAGRIVSINSSYHSTNKKLAFEAVFAPSNTYTGQQGPVTKAGNLPNGFFLVMSNGASPDPSIGQAIFYLDATDQAAPKLIVYQYNSLPQDSFPSYAYGPYYVSPKKIISSLSSSSWIYELSVTDSVINGLTHRKIKFSIDSTPILNFTNFSPSAHWIGTGFNERYGFWFHPISNLTTSYASDGFISSWSVPWSDAGFYDAEYQYSFDCHGQNRLLEGDPWGPSYDACCVCGGNNTVCNQDPTGVCDGLVATANGAKLVGWACDKDIADSPVSVQVYKQPSGSKQAFYIGGTIANVAREKAVAVACSSTNSNHGIDFDIPDVNAGDQIYAYAVNINRAGYPQAPDKLLLNCPLTLVVPTATPASSITPVQTPVSTATPTGTLTRTPTPSATLSAACTTKNIKESISALDQSVAAIRGLININLTTLSRNIGKLSRKEKNRIDKLSKKMKTDAGIFYNEAWTTIWTTPQDIITCPSSLTQCAVQDLSGIYTKYATNQKLLIGLSEVLVKEYQKIFKKGQLASKGKAIRNAVSKEARNGNILLSLIPAKHSVCK